MQTFSPYVQAAPRTELCGPQPRFGRISALQTTLDGLVGNSKLAKLFYVSGAVQGVGYRYFTQRVSQRIGVAGYVKNLRDGRVEVYAMGSASQLSALRLELERGPQGASVSEVFDEEASIEAKYSGQFSIEQDSW